MFSGNFEYTVDERGRIAIPAPWRKSLEETSLIDKLVITRGFDQCIAIYTLPQWKVSFEDNLPNLDYTNQEHRDFIHLFISARVIEDVDKQGRIMLPAALRSEFSIARETMIAGAGKFFEVWNLDTYKDYIQAARGKASGVLGNIGFKL